MKNFLLLSSLIVILSFSAEAQPEFSGDILTQYTHHDPLQLQKKKLTRATATRSDTFDILHYIVNLDITNFTQQQIKGSCVVQFKSKMNGNNLLLLDLMKLNVDSIRQDNQVVSFSYTDSMILKINLLNTLQLGDSEAVTVYYHGHPQIDTGDAKLGLGSFGGFYFSGAFAYNIGISLYEIPHQFGRVWHPCFDNFTERATYEYNIITDTSKMALCNGSLTGSVNNGDGTKTWSWKMNETIPSYLAGIGVAPFTIVHMTFNGLNGPVPVELGAVPADTTNMKNAFVNLPAAFSIFEQHYGPYRWNKVGYCIVPFMPGALEHSTNIAYPELTLSFGKAYENLMAHELAHHWFGNLITPYDATNMWLKEGWAVFSEKLFYEGVYGYTNYINSIKSNHEVAVHYANVFDNGYKACYPIPEEYAYGQTTYAKGPDMVHVLRTYMGDTLFFHCLQNLLVDSAFKAIDCYAFRDYLSNCSGIDLTSYFNDWLFSPGFPHFSIDSFEVSQNPSGWYDVMVHIRQRLDNAPHYYTNVPIEITFMNTDRQTVTEKLYVNGACTLYNTTIPFNPAFACLDLGNKISDAITDDYQTIGSKGTTVFTNGKMNVTVNSIGDSVFLRVEHNYIAPDPMKHKIPNLHLSEERYWRVDGVIPSGFDASASIKYNGTNPPPTSTNNGAYLDTKLITASEDSLVLMYRPSVSADWQVDSDIVRNEGTKTDKVGTFVINHLKKGEYALAIYQANKVDSTITASTDSCQTVLAVKEISTAHQSLVVYPNPSLGNFNIQGILDHNSQMEVFNLHGQRIYQKALPKGALNMDVNGTQWGEGIFLIRMYDNYGNMMLKKVVIQK